MGQSHDSLPCWPPTEAPYVFCHLVSLREVFEEKGGGIVDGEEGSQGNLAFLKMLKSSALAQEVVNFITDLREGKELTDEVWWQRFEVAISQWLVTKDYKRGWMKILLWCWEDPRPTRTIRGKKQVGDRRPWKNKAIREKIVEHLVEDVQLRFEGDVLSHVSYALGPSPWKDQVSETDISYRLRVKAKRAKRGH